MKREIRMEIKGDIWVFGYGSLMWAPGFEYLEQTEAVLEGYHRDLCILSYVFRGTPEVPGLVMGLNKGGRCRGRAFRVASDLVEETLSYLHEREMINNVYEPSWVDLSLQSNKTVKAYTFIAIPEHKQHVGSLSIDEISQLVLQGQGKNGSSLEYLESCLFHLRQLDIVDARLEAIFVKVQGAKRP
jgi:glutathione-specific gamma-glutamylcyclotransferase